MKNLTTPQAILFGFALLAIAIASIPLTTAVVKPAIAGDCDMGGVEWQLSRINKTMSLF